MSKLNYFTLAPTDQTSKENGLTKAYLALLRLSPQAMNHFLNLVERKLWPDSRLPALNELSAQLSTILTQVKSIPQSLGTLVSILLRHANTQKPHEIVWSDRQPIYDGVICFDPSLILTIETKLGNICDLTQLNPAISSFHQETQQTIKSDSNPYNTDLTEMPDSVKLYRQPIILEWPEIMNGLSNLYLSGSSENKSSNPLSNIETTLFQDFFAFVQTNFHQYGLGPYSNLKMCNQVSTLVQKRCDNIMGEIAKKIPECQTELAYSRYDGWYILLEKESAQRLWILYFDDSKSIRLGFYPGDTVNQARKLYGKADLRNLIKLSSDGWIARPNLHLSYRSSHLLWPNACADLKVQTYLDYWANHQDSIRQWKYDEWPKLMEELEKSGQVSQGDLKEFLAKFKNMPTMNLCPGLALERGWPLNDAAILDGKKKFVEVVMKESEKVLKSVP